MENAGNSISKPLDFKIFRGSMPPYPPSGSRLQRSRAPPHLYYSCYGTVVSAVKQALAAEQLQALNLPATPAASFAMSWRMVATCNRTGQSAAGTKKDSGIFQSNLFETQFHQQIQPQ